MTRSADEPNPTYSQRLHLQVRAWGKEIGAVDRGRIDRRNVERLRHHVDGPLHALGLDRAQALAPYVLGENRMLDREIKPAALDFFIDQRIALLDRRNGEVGIANRDL